MWLILTCFFEKKTRTHSKISYCKLSRATVEDFIREIIFSCLFSTHQLPDAFYQAPGRRPPHIIDRGVKTVILGWVGSPNQHDASRVHGALVGFVDRCQTCKIVHLLYDINRYKRIESSCRLFSKHQLPNVFSSDTWSAPSIYYRPRCENCNTRVGRYPFRVSS